MSETHALSCRAQLHVCTATAIVLLCGAVQAGAADPLVIEVAAGACDREATVLSVDLPVALRGVASLELREMSTQALVPVQMDRGAVARAVWILPHRLTAGKVERYRLQAASAAAPAPAVSVTDDGKRLWAAVGAKRVLAYNHAVVPAPNPKEPYYARSGHLHPVFNPSGQALSDDMNAEHTHQHGIMFAWRHSRFEGRESDCWDQKSGQGRVEHVKTEAFGGGPVFGHFTTRLRHTCLNTGGAPKPMLDEVWRVQVYNQDGPFVFDLESVQTCSGHSPVVVEKYHYGGMAIRGSAEWFKPKPPFDYLTGEGKGRDGDQSRARWVDFFGAIGARPTGILVVDHPGNFRYPQPVRLHPKLPYFCFAPAALGGFSIEPGKPHVSRYRFYIHDGQLTPETAARLARDFADPPTIRMLSEKEQPTTR